MKFSIEYANVFSTILARENIFIKIDGSRETASFDLVTRTLILPAWDGTRELQRFLMCHEISHCLFTPAMEWETAILSRPKEHQASYKQVLNVFEDARVDRLMPEKYPTMIKWYYEGYQQLSHDQDFFGLNAEPEKLKTYDLLSKINLWFKTHNIGNPYGVSFDSSEMHWIDRANKTRSFNDVKKLADEFFDQMSDEEKTSVSSTLIIIISGFCDADCDEFGKLPCDTDNETKHGGKTNNPETKQFVSNKSNIIVKDDDFRTILAPFKNTIKTIHELPSNAIIKKMVIDFQRHQNARKYTKALITKTGVLDPIKLHSYAYNDDIMRRKTMLPKNKNHGFVFIVDMSGSMLNIWSSVVDGLYVMAMFCKKLNMPFVAYGFEDKVHNCSLAQTRFCLKSLLSSSDTIKRINNQYHTLKDVHPASMTPLTSAVHYSKSIVLDFQQTHMIDVMNVIFITDGGCTYNVPAQSFTDQKTRKTFEACVSYSGQMGSVAPLMKILRHRTGANVWAYHISGTDQFRFVEECGGTTGAFFVNPQIMNDYKAFVEIFTKKMSEYGGKIETYA